jgi:hypothetical protein
LSATTRKCFEFVKEELDETTLSIEKSAARTFFKWALEDGNDEAGTLHHVALLEMYWNARIANRVGSAAN